MTLNQALGEWVVAHPWLTFFVLLAVANIPSRLMRLRVRVKS